MPSKKILVEDLSLKISQHGLPFDLVGAEMRFGPDDWAWQFLRLNEKYRTDYERFQRGEASVGFPNHPRSRYGLDWWLDPTTIRLPERQGARSWFEPLMDIVDAPEWDADAFPNEIGPQSPEYSLHLAHLPEIPINGDEGVSTKVWFAIDCSVLLAGQLELVSRCAKDYRLWFREEGLKKTSQPKGCRELLNLDQCRYFDAKGFTNAIGAKDKSATPALYWRAIRVDVYGSISQQINEYREDLETIYQGFLVSEAVEPPFLEKLRFFFSKGQYGNHQSDGFPLKILALVGQLHQHGMQDEEIAKFVVQNSCYGRYDEETSKNWAADLIIRIPTYLQHAASFVEDGYRFLIRGQKIPRGSRPQRSPYTN